MKKPETLKDRIKAKFRNVSRFSRLIGWDISKVHHALSRNNADEATLEELLLSTEDRALEGELTTEDVAKVRKCVDAADSLRAFCRDNGLDLTVVSGILSGNRKAKSALVSVVLAKCEEAGV